MPSPSFSDRLGRFIQSASLDLADESAVSASGSGNPEQPARDVLMLELDVTAADTADGDETLDVDVETSPDGSTWTTAGSFPTQDAVGSVREAFGPGLDQYVRVTWTVGGTTPSFDFTVKAV